MRRIFRIQNSRGLGAYLVDWGDMPADKLLHPSPFSELELRFAKQRQLFRWYFGFASLDQLKKWFFQESWLQAMDEAGLELTVWEVPKRYTHISQTQAIFERRKARQIARFKLTKLDKAKTLFH
jgi:hypothetical protein